MATSLHELPSTEDAAQVAKERKAEARKHLDAIKKANDLEQVSSLRIGWHASILKREGLFGLLGFESEDETRKATGVGRSTWYDNIRIAEAFKDLTEDQFCSMKHANAKAASDLPESKRLSREWIRMAGSMKIEDFAAKVDEEMNGKAKPSDGKERGTVLKMPMPASSKVVIETGLKEYAQSIGIPENDPGKALELLVTEHSGQTSLVQAITNAVQRIKAAKKLKKTELSTEELVVKLYETLDEIALEMGAALSAVQNLDSSGKQ